MGTMDIKEYAYENSIPIIQDEGLNLLLETIKNNNVVNILELGTAIGYSAISIAKKYPHVMIDTIERDNDLYVEAYNNILAKRLQHKIIPYNMDIKDYTSEKIYDLIFVDAAKSQYLNYLEQFYDNLKIDGIYFFDNMEFHGLVDKPELCTNRNTKQLVKKIKRFYDIIINDKRFKVFYYKNIGDGILILKKKEKDNE